jgi:hypothetical protein
LKKTEQLDHFQKTLINGLLLSLIVAFGLMWLHPIIGKKSGRIFWHVLFLQDVPAAWLYLALLLIAFPLAMAKGIATWRLPPPETIATWVEAKISWIALTALPFYALFAVFAAHRHPLALDEYSVLFQSQVLASGHLIAAVPPDVIDWMFPADGQGFLFFVSHARGEAISPYWPGFALLLAPFSLLGVPWLCNPIITSLWIVFLHRLTLQITASRQAAAWAVLFALTSPVIALNAAAYFSMPAHLLANTIYAWLLVRGGKRDSFIAGLVGGYALILHNPLPHLLFSLPWLVYLAFKRKHQLLPLLCGYALFLVPVVKWGSFLSQFDPSPLAKVVKVKVAAVHSNVHSNPFAKVIGTIQGLLIFPSRSLWLTRFAGFCKLVVWATPGLVILSLTAVRSAKEIVYLRLLCYSVLLTFVTYLFIRFDQGLGWGFRYLHPVWMALPILAGYFLVQMPAGARLGALSLRRYFAVCAALSLFLFIPYRAFQVERFVAGQLAQFPPAQGAATITFVNVEHGYHSANLVQNDPYLRNNHWKMVHRGDEKDAAFSRRFLLNARLVEQGKWGQIWAGDCFNRIVG